MIHWWSCPLTICVICLSSISIISLEEPERDKELDYRSQDPSTPCFIQPPGDENCQLIAKERTHAYFVELKTDFPVHGPLKRVKPKLTSDWLVRMTLIFCPLSAAVLWAVQYPKLSQNYTY